MNFCDSSNINHSPFFLLKSIAIPPISKMQFSLIFSLLSIASFVAGRAIPDAPLNKDSLDIITSRSDINELSDVNLDLVPRVVPSSVKVKLWEGLGSGTKTDPTYYNDLSIGLMKPEVSEIGEYARLAYVNMMGQLGLDLMGNRPKKDGKEQPRLKDDYLMAALYIPNYGIFLCSIPQPAAKKYITANAAVDAPALWARIKDRTPSGSAHSEDGAAFRYEKSLKTKLAATDHYPVGSVIRVYGSFKGKTPDFQPLCSTGSKIDPACSPVFTSLGVAH